MSRPSQTASAVLGVLSVEAMTGYEVRRAISSVLGHFWHESFGQIYPCLSELEDDGLVHATPGQRPNSRRYEITDDGRSRLAELLSQEPPTQPLRNGTLLRVFFGRALPPGALGALLDEQEAQAHARMAGYAAIRDELASEDSYADHLPYWLATVRAGELTTEAQLTWLAETREALVDAPA